jgi:hypothetical protein
MLVARIYMGQKLPTVNGVSGGNILNAVLTAVLIILCVCNTNETTTEDKKYRVEALTGWRCAG